MYSEQQSVHAQQASPSGNGNSSAFDASSDYDEDDVAAVGTNGYSNGFPSNGSPGRQGFPYQHGSPQYGLQPHGAEQHSPQQHRYRSSSRSSIGATVGGRVVMKGYMQKQHVHSRLGQRRWVRRFYELHVMPANGGMLKYANRDEGVETKFKSAVQLSQPKNRLLVCWVTEERTIGLAFADGNEMLLRCR
jgi:hypothetical protein